MAGGFVAGTSASGTGGGGASKTFLLAAVVLGVLATLLAFAFIQGTAGEDRGPRTRIVVVARDIRANVAIDPDRDLKIDEIPTKYAAFAGQGLNVEALSNYKGQRLNRPINAGQPVFLRDLSATATLELKGDERALTIPAEPGIIIPGDRVKLLVSRPDPSAPPEARGSQQVTLIGQGNGYRVLAVGGSLFKTRQAVTAAEQYETSSVNAKTVTLAVTEQEATEIQGALASGQGRPTLLLCPPTTAPATQQ
jgi:Flp pilus assembly protein CpaB